MANRWLVYGVDWDGSFPVRFTDNADATGWADSPSFPAIEGNEGGGLAHDETDDRWILSAWNNKIYTSDDGGDSWTERFTAAGRINNFAHDPNANVWIGVASVFSSGYAYKSTDRGLTWALAQSGIGAGLNDIAWGGNLFVAVGNSGNIQTSPDGDTWTTRTGDTGTNTLRGVAYNGTDTWVYVGSGSSIATSPDGITWTARTSPDTATWYTVHWNETNSLFIIGGSDGKLATSPDGITWTSRNSDWQGSGTNIFRIAGNDTVIAAAGSQRNVSTSTDGITWTSQDFDSSNNFDIDRIEWASEPVVPLPPISLNFTVVDPAFTKFDAPCRQPYGIELLSAFREPWLIGIESSHGEPWGIEVGAAAGEPWAVLTQLENGFRQSWGIEDKANLERGFRQPYAAEAGAAHRQPWSILLDLESSHRVPYGMLFALEPGYRMPYGLLDYAQLESRYNQPYGIFDPASAFFTGTVRATIGSHTVPLIDWQIETDEGRSYLQADLQLLRPADYSRFKLNGAFTLEIFGQSYSLIVDSKSQPRSRDGDNNPQIETRIQGISPAAKRDFPRAQALTKTWDEPIMASAAAQEAAGLPITWNMVDWQIPAFRLAIVDASPMAVARRIVEAAGGVLESEPGGTLRARTLWPVTVPAISAAAADVALTERGIYRVEERAAPLRLMNRVRIVDVEASQQDRLEFEPDQDDGLRGIVRAYPSPWRENLTVRTTRGSPPVFLYPAGVLTRTETETVEVVAGVARTQYPVQTLTASQYLAEELGGVGFEPFTAELHTAVAGYSLLQVEYTVRYLEYSAVSLIDTEAQLLLEEPEAA